MPKFVTVKCDDETLTHLPAAADYATLCGLDGDDPAIGLYTLPTPKGAKIDCEQCQAIWLLCKQFRSSSFKETGK